MIHIYKIVIKHCKVNVATRELMEQLRKTISEQWAGADVEFLYDEPTLDWDPNDAEDDYNEELALLDSDDGDLDDGKEDSDE